MKLGNAKLLVLPALALGGAALILAPSRSARAFDKIGGSGSVLPETERDVRLFNNFLDSQANNNVTQHAQFPGFDGAELAIWKGVVEWGSRFHGDGTGDSGPPNNPLGSGGANFDAFWAGNTNAVGTSNDTNIVSVTASCGGGGTLAFTEVDGTVGWRIVFCDEWTWQDGPGTITSGFDIQGVMAHEYGHALGLDHSAVSGATMWPSVSSANISIRSITTDDAAGVQCIYGVASATKPIITATVADSGANTITIYGSQFGSTGNEVWFTNANVTGVNVDPIVRVTGVASTNGNTEITVTIPVNASPGDVMINKSGTGGSTLSNAFPTDLEGVFGDPPIPHPEITNITPSTIDSLIPGTTETITLTGTDLDSTTDVLLDGVPVPAANYTIVNATTITLDMPQASSLGAHDIGVTDGLFTEEFTVNIVAPATPKLQIGNGNAGNAVDKDVGLDIWVGGQGGSWHLVRGGPTSTALSPLELKTSIVPHHGSPLVDAGPIQVHAKGWNHVKLGGLPDPALVGSTWFFRAYALERPVPFPESNLQSITLVP